MILYYAIGGLAFLIVINSILGLLITKELEKLDARVTELEKR